MTPRSAASPPDEQADRSLGKLGMAGLPIDTVVARAPRVRTRRRQPARRRSWWDALLWGPAAEWCAECGAEVEAGSAYRQSARQVYCSFDHARRDLEE